MADAGASHATVVLEQTGALSALAALSQLPLALGPKGLLEEARAAETDLIRDTLSAAIAFVLPGDDEYSVAQGESFPGPGGIGAGVLDPLLEALDHFVPAALPTGGEITVPAAGAVATLLNSFALEVNPAAANGALLSPFARLSFAEKAEAFRRFEADAVITEVVPELNFVASIAHGYIAFLCFSECGVLDPATRQVTGTPVGWQIAGYTGPANGYAEFRGYYRGRKKAVKRRRRRKRKRA